MEPRERLYELEGDAPGLVWLAKYSDLQPKPYCKQHRLKLIRHPGRHGYLMCAEDKEVFKLRLDWVHDADLARQKIFNQAIEELELVRIDPLGYQVLAKETVKKNPDYWLEAKLSNTAKGLQLMVQVGKKNESGQKVQLFVEPAAKRIDFDQSEKDIHPVGLFSLVTAEFKNSKTTIKNKEV
jgi:hypothetical protein